MIPTSHIVKKEGSVLCMEISVSMILLTLATVNLNKFLLTQESEVSQNPLYLHWSLAKQLKTLPPLKGKTWSHTLQKNFVPKQWSLLWIITQPSCVMAIECYYFTVMSLNFTSLACELLFSTQVPHFPMISLILLQW